MQHRPAHNHDRQGSTASIRGTLHSSWLPKIPSGASPQACSLEEFLSVPSSLLHYFSQNFWNTEKIIFSWSLSPGLCWVSMNLLLQAPDLKQLLMPSSIAWSNTLAPLHPKKLQNYCLRPPLLLQQISGYHIWVTVMWVSDTWFILWIA